MKIFNDNKYNMNNSIYNQIVKNTDVNEWLLRKDLINKLAETKDDAIYKIQNEATSKIVIDEKLKKYCDELLDINNDLQLIQELRIKEKQFSSGIIQALILVFFIISAIAFALFN